MDNAIDTYMPVLERQAVRLLSGGVAFRETTLQVSAAVHEPHGVSRSM